VNRLEIRNRFTPAPDYAASTSGTEAKCGVCHVSKKFSLFRVPCVDVDFRHGLHVGFHRLPLSGIVYGSGVNDDSATVIDRFLGKEKFEMHGIDATQPIMTFAVTGGSTVKVPLFTEMTAGVTGTSVVIPVVVLDVPSEDLGGYQFKLTYDTAVVTVAVTGAIVQGGHFPFDAITAENTPPATGGETAEWNHFQGGSVPVPALTTVANITFEPVGVAGECTNLDITVVALVDNASEDILNSDEDGQLCLVAVDAESVTDLVAAQDVDNVLLPTRDSKARGVR